MGGFDFEMLEEVQLTDKKGLLQAVVVTVLQGLLHKLNGFRQHRV